MPPKRAGWRLTGYPDFVPQMFREKYAENPIWNGNSPSEVVNHIKTVLLANGVKIDKVALCEWANEQWCEADPERCNTAQGKGSRLASRRANGYMAEPMQWATPFWKVWNVGISDANRDQSEARPTMELFADAAVHLVGGESGCPKCAKHFRELLAKYPLAKVNNWRQARVWLWRVHNESRDSGRTVPYHEIAKTYGWESIEPAEVLRIVEEELRA